MATKRTPKGDKPADEVGQLAMDRYLSRISGPLIDRIDIHVEVPAVPHKQLMGEGRGTDSANMQGQVLAARKIQTDRNGSSTKPNSALSGKELDRIAKLDDAGREIVKQAMTELGLSARAYDKVRRVARTIADLDGKEAIEMNHVAEAISYRLLDRRR